MKVLWQARCFAAEDQHDIRRSAERCVPEQPRGLRGEEERLTQRRQPTLERDPVGPHAQVDILPVVESRPLDLTLVEREPEWLDEMQRGADRETRPAGVAGVPVNLRVHQNHMQRPRHWMFSRTPTGLKCWHGAAETRRRGGCWC